MRPLNALAGFCLLVMCFCTSTIHAQCNPDTENPVITDMPDNITQAAEDGLCGATVTWDIPSASDNCEINHFTAGQVPNDFYAVGITTVTYTAVDTSGNMAAASFTITIMDDQDPSISDMPDDIELDSEEGECGAEATWDNPSADDNCGILSLVSDHDSGDSFPVGTTIVTYTATDVNGNAVTATFQVIVTDIEDPSIVQMETVTANNDEGDCSALVSWTEPNASDNCDVTSLTPDLANGSIFPVGTTEVTYTAEDEAGNSVTMSFDVVVSDTEDPTIDGLSADLTPSAAAGTCGADVTWTEPTALDNCPDANIAQTAGDPSGSNFAVGQHTITYTATDAAGNTHSESFTITVSDDEDPVFDAASIPADISEDNHNGNCSGVADWDEPTADDNCDMLSVSSPLGQRPGDTFPVGETTITYTAIDIHGNMETVSFTITINDVEDPTISDQDDLTANAADGTCAATVSWTEPTPSDNCPGATITQTGGAASGSSFDVGTHTIEYTATDAASNTATMSFDIVVSDTQDPTISDQDDLTADAAIGTCAATVSWTEPTPSDNCSATVIQTGGAASGSSFDVGTHTITYTATDASSNTATMSFDIVVSDTQDPTISGLSADLTPSADAGTCGADVSWDEPTALDNCAGSSIAQTAGDPSGSNFAVGSHTITYTATDTAGNTHSESFTITVSDDEDPTISDQDDLTADAADGTCAATVSWTEPTPSDNCPGATIAQTDGAASGSSFDVGTHTIEYTATDDAGNTATMSFDIVVSDTQDPSIIGLSADLSADAADGTCAATISWDEPTVSDNCPDASISQTGGGANGSSFDVGTHTITYTATDASNNTAELSFDIVVSDTQNPTISDQDDLTANAAIGTCAATVSWTEPTQSDNCAESTIAQTGGAANGSSFDVGTHTIEYTATDASSNTSTMSFDIVVSDTQNPTISDQDDLTANAADGTCAATVSWTEPTVDDNCSATVNQTDGAASGSSFDVGTHTITYTATDDAGNTDTMSFDIVVSDTQNPTISAQADLTADSQDGGESADPVLATLDIVSVPEYDPGDESWSLIAFEMDQGPYNQNGALRWIGQSFGAVGDNSFNLGPTLTDYADEILIVNGDDYYLFTTSEPFFEPTKNQNMAITSIETNDAQLNAKLTSDGGAKFCRAYTPADRYGDTSWGIIPNGSSQRSCGCNSGGWSGYGVYYGGTQAGQQNSCAGWGGRFAGYKNSGQQKGGVSTGFDTKIYVRNNLVNTDPCGATVTWDEPTVSDNCPDASIAQTGGGANGSSFDVGTHTITYSATDASSNTSTMSFDIVVSDTQDPTISDQDDLTANAAEGTCAAIVSWTEPTADDNCPESTIAQTGGAANGSSFDVGTHTITYTATDASSNTATMSFDIVVSDTQNPTINDQDDLTANAADGTCAATVSWTEPTPSDNCPGATINQTGGAASGSSFDVGTHTIEYTATDAASNTATMSFDIVVSDTQDPTISDQDDLTADAAIGTCAANVSWTEPTVEDNCSATVTQTGGAASGSSFDVGTHTITYTATDASSNTAMMSFDIVVSDTQDPTISDQDDLTADAADGTCAATVSWTEPTPSDNCPDASIAQTGGAANGSSFDVGTHTITYTATDAASNTSTMSFDIVVSDAQDPTINGLSDITQTLAQGSCEMEVTWDAPTASDNCTGASVEQTGGDASGSNFGPGSYTITYTATDAANNTFEDSFTITINDNDFDGDGIDDCSDDDIDNDGALNDADSDDFNNSVCSDTDGDGCDDCSQGGENSNDPANDGPDSDGDGICDDGDNCSDPLANNYLDPANGECENCPNAPIFNGMTVTNNASTLSSADGAITLDITGNDATQLILTGINGAPNYNISLPDDLDNLEAGYYTAMVQDADGCWGVADTSVGGTTLQQPCVVLELIIRYDLCCSGCGINDTDADGICDDDDNCTDQTQSNYADPANTDCACSGVLYNGHCYETVEINGNTWFAENLRTTTFSDGSEIPLVELNDGDELTGDVNSQRVLPENDAANLDQMGYFYSGATVTDSRGLCPTGWSIPSGEDVATLSEATNGLAWELADASLWPDAENIITSTNPHGFSAGASGCYSAGSSEWYYVHTSFKMWQITNIPQLFGFCGNEPECNQFSIFGDSSYYIGVRCVQD